MSVKDSPGVVPNSKLVCTQQFSKGWTQFGEIKGELPKLICHPHKASHVCDILRSLHLKYCCDFLRVGIYPISIYDVTQKSDSALVENALLGIQGDSCCLKSL